MSGKIHRFHKSRDFVVLDTDALNRPNLSWKAKGLHAYIMQLPPDWDLNIADLKRRSSDGRDGTASGIQELIDAGLLIRFQVFDEAGRFSGYEYHCFERPEQAEAWLLENGKAVNGKTINGKTVNGKTVNGKTVNGKTVNGKTVNGKTVTSKHLTNPKTKEINKQEINNPESKADFFVQLEDCEPIQNEKNKALGQRAAAPYSEGDVENEIKKAEVRFFYVEIINLGVWGEYLSYRRKQHYFSFKSASSQAKAVEQLYEFCQGDTEVAQKIIFQTIANGWAGLFPLKNLRHATQNEKLAGQKQLDAFIRTPNFYGNDDTSEFFTGIE